MKKFKGILLVIFLVISLVWVTSCSTNPHKAQKIDTSVENTQNLSGDSVIGIKDGNMVVQKKVLMNEELRNLEIEVYEMEDHVYGNRKYGSQGLHGVLKECRTDLSSPKYGGNGKLSWTEPIDRVTENEEEFKIGIDEKNKLVGVTEEFLKDRIVRFQGYKKVLRKRQDDLEEKVAICKAELNSRKAGN